MDAIDAEFSLDGARRAAEQDALAEWVRRFLSSPGSDNAELGDQLTSQERWWVGPQPLAIDSLHRLAGPPEDPVLVAVDDDHWGDGVEDMADMVADDGWQPPPVVVVYRNDQLVLEDGNHRVEALRRAGVDDAWAVIGFDGPEDRTRFATLGCGGDPNGEQKGMDMSENTAGTRLTCTDEDCACELEIVSPCPHGSTYTCACGHPLEPITS
jgi:hypothetical protein